MIATLMGRNEEDFLKNLLKKMKEGKAKSHVLLNVKTSLSHKGMPNQGKHNEKLEIIADFIFLDSHGLLLYP